MALLTKCFLGEERSSSAHPWSAEATLMKCFPMVSTIISLSTDHTEERYGTLERIRLFCRTRNAAEEDMLSVAFKRLSEDQHNTTNIR